MIRLTASDITQTRSGNPTRLTMRFPADPDTTRRLQAVLQVDLAASVSRWRRVWRQVSSALRRLEF